MPSEVTTDIEQITVQECAPIFLEGLRTRRRHPASAATLSAYGSYLRKWIVPLLGRTPLAQVDNGIMKKFVDELVLSDLKPATISGICICLKLLIGSVLDENGNERFPRKWNNDFIDAPPVIPGAQKAPLAASGAVQAALQGSDGCLPALLALLAGTGLRISEALALRIGPDDYISTIWDPEKMTIYVRQAVRKGNLQGTKTPAGVREVDVHSALNEYLLKQVQKSPGEFLFTSRGNGLLYSTSLYERIKNLGIPGFHSLRRFRITHLESMGVPRTLVTYWDGHSTPGDMTARYAKFGKDAESRKIWCERAGLGFELPKEA